MIERAWSPSVLQALAASIRDHAGLSFVPERYDELERRTRRAMAKAGIADVRDYAEGLGSGRISFDDWVAELTVGETYFFREPRHFDFLRRRALPGLLALRSEGHVFRVWSAGCASGEEAFSLAILFEQQFMGSRLHLVGTDVSRAALAKARVARYGRWSLRGVSEDWIDAYFRRCPGKQFELADRIRRQVTFEYLNLALDEYPSFFTGVWGNDVIFCRNVMIYLDRDTVRGVARRLFESLADGGWLITGPSDPPLGDYAPFETILTDDGLFYRRSQERVARRSATAPVPANDAAAVPRSAVEKDHTTDLRVVSANNVSASPTAAETERVEDGAGAAAVEVRATANSLGAREAARLCTAALQRFPLGVELYVLQASLLLDLRDYESAAQAARRLLYLDRSLVVAHLLLGSILGKIGEREQAARAFRNARDLAGSASPNDVVPFAEGEKAGRLADFACAQMQLLDAAPRGNPKGLS
jgi:chemotaxis protein methyltransferase CheR